MEGRTVILCRWISLWDLGLGVSVAGIGRGSLVGNKARERGRGHGKGILLFS